MELSRFLRVTSAGAIARREVAGLELVAWAMEEKADDAAALL